MTIEEVIKEATARGITGLPEPSRLTHIRVWPAPPQWIAEVGQPPHNQAIGEGLYEAADEARSAAVGVVSEERQRLAALLPGDLAATASTWPEPVIDVWE